MEKKTGNNNTNQKQTTEVKETVPTQKVWNESEVKLLKKWAELSGSYRVLHDRAHRKYKYLNYCATIPVIIFSTILGTASFSQTTFPVKYQSYIPMGIGTLNIISGIITTVAQFTRVSELSEANRVASISYGKFSRNIATELALPPEFRSYSGIDFVQICRSEFDRLVEQSPIIPIEILTSFMQEIASEDITKPDIMTVSKIEEYKPTKEEKAAKIIANAFQTMHNRKRDSEKTGVQKMAEMVQKKGFQMVDRIQKTLTPTSFKEAKVTVNDKVQELQHLTKAVSSQQIQQHVQHEVEEQVKNQMETTISNQVHDIENQVEQKKNQLTPFVAKQVEQRTKELNNIQSGFVANLIKKSESFRSSPSTSSSIPLNPLQNTVAPIKSNILNIIHKAKHNLEDAKDSVQETTHDIENQIQSSSSPDTNNPSE